MAKLEIPSIVVQSGSGSLTPPGMEHTRTGQWSTQTTFEEDADPPICPHNETDQRTTFENGESTSPVQSPSQNPSVPSTPNTTTNNNVLTRSRSKNSLKVLKRSFALNESTSPPPDIGSSPLSPTLPTSSDVPPISNNVNVPSHNAGVNNVSVPTTRPIVKKEGSCGSNWSSFSRGNSTENQLTDPAIEDFLINTLNESAKDRAFLLQIEAELINLKQDDRKNTHKFGAMSSYQRMLVHRAAEYFGMDHFVDPSGFMVIVNKTQNSRMPQYRFSAFIREGGANEEPRKSILKRDSASFEEAPTNFRSSDRHTTDAPRRSKSFEEREEAYAKARRRIFHQEQRDGLSSDERFRWHGGWNPNDTESTNNKLHPNSSMNRKLTKNESYETKDQLKANSLRDSVAKANSFDSSATRVLTKQDSGSSVSSRVSPSSSGYKSLRSDTTLSATPSPTATPHLPTQLSNQSEVHSPEPEADHEPTVVWAVTNMNSVPVGSVIINPQNGQPLTNPDGSVYHFDPANPPNLEATRMNNNLMNDGGDVVNDPVIVDEHVPTRHNQEPNNTRVEPPRVMHMPPAPSSRDPPYQQPENTSSHVSSMNMYGAMNHQPPLTSYYQGPTPAQLCGSAHLQTHPHRGLVMGTTVPHHYSTPINQPYAASYTSDAYAPPNPTAYGSLPPAPPHYSAAVPPTVQSFNMTQGVPIVLPGPTQSVGVAPQASYQPRPSLYTQQPPVQYAMTERPTALECNYQPPITSHTYFTRCPAGSQVGQTRAVTPNYCGNNGAAGGLMGIVPLPHSALTQAPPSSSRPYHRMATPPSTPQNGVTQYNLFSTPAPTCYPPYQPPQPQPLPLPSLLRPSLQLNVCNSPPVRPNYTNTTRSPDSQRFGATANPNPMYRFTYPTNELFLLNPSRSAYPSSSQANNIRSPAVNNSARRQRPRPNQSAANSRTVLSVGAASQQQAALATAIEAAVLAVPGTGIYK